MVSPRKRVDHTWKESASSQARPAPADAAAAATVAAKPKKSLREVFAGKKFFLDLKPKSLSSERVKQLILDIQYLGGSIEEFFSGDVTHVISDAPETRLTRIVRPAPAATPTPSASSIVAGHSFAPSPCTPLGTPSAANSPWSPPNETPKSPKSRVEKILERARQNYGGCASAPSSFDILDNAQRLKKQIWSLPKVQIWVDNFKARYFKPAHFLTSTPKADLKGKRGGQASYSRSHSLDTGLQQRYLTAPYMKFEVTNHQYRPVFQELKRFPKLHLAGRKGTSPFTLPEAEKPLSKLRVLKERQESNQVHTASRKCLLREHPAVTVAANNARGQDRHFRGGYCEICECPFSDLQEHLSSKVHLHRINGNDFWSKLDSCIEQVNGKSEDDEHSVVMSD